MRRGVDVDREGWPERGEAEPALDEDDEDAEEAEVESEDEDEGSAGRDHAPGEFEVPDGVAVIEGEARGGVRPVAIVVSRFNAEFTTRMLDRALDELEEIGVPRAQVTVMPVPGAFELPLAAMALAKTRRFTCIIALGCVIRGETPHWEYVASEAASGLQLAGLETGVPVAFGVLTVESAEQARARIGRAADAVRSALEMADAFSQLRATAARAS